MLSLGLMPYTSCKHQPSCSDYSKTVILKYGTIVGLTKTIKRVISCR